MIKMNSEIMMCHRVVTVPHYTEHWSEATFSPSWEGVGGWVDKGRSLGSTKKPLKCFRGFSVLPQGLEPWTPTLRVSCSTN